MVDRLQPVLVSTTKTVNLDVSRSGVVVFDKEQIAPIDGKHPILPLALWKASRRVHVDELVIGMIGTMNLNMARTAVFRLDKVKVTNINGPSTIIRIIELEARTAVGIKFLEVAVAR